MKSEWNKLDNARQDISGGAVKKRYAGIQIFLRIIQNSKQRPFAKATEDTLEEFDIFKSILRRGLFWYYLEGIGYKTDCTRRI